MRSVTAYSTGIGMMLMLVGCYTYVPVAGTDRAVGQSVAFVINDRGRIGLAERMGSGVSRVEGRFLREEGTTYVVEVFHVGQIGGRGSTWAGETVQLDRDFVDRVEGRQLSKGRTFLLAAGAAAAVAVLIASTDLLGFSRPEDEPPPPPPPTSKTAPGRTRTSPFMQFTKP